MPTVGRHRGGGGGGGVKAQLDPGKYVRYTSEQLEALERLYGECPKPSSVRRQQLIRECPSLANVEPRQIKVWFQNRRCREKQRKESSRLETINRKLNAMNKLLMEENDRLQKQVSLLTYDNGYMRQQLHTTPVSTTDNSCESAVTSGRHPQQDANNPASLLVIAEETMAAFLSKATGTAIDWVPMLGMKPGPDSIGIITVSRNCSGIAARACGLVSLEPAKVAEVLKDRASWLRDCRRFQVRSVIPTGNGGIIELLYTQMYAPTTLASARDFWTLRYTAGLEDGGLAICERSMAATAGISGGDCAPNFARGAVLPSGFLIRPCEGGGSVVHIVDHVDLDAGAVPEVLRPLYESPKLLAQKVTLAAMRHVRQMSQEASGDVVCAAGYHPGALRTLRQRLYRGFNDAVNGFPDDGWSLLGSEESTEDVVISVNSSSSAGGGVLCAKASMLLYNVSPSHLIRFLREHRPEWAGGAACVGENSGISGMGGGQAVLPLAQTVDQDEILEVIRLENAASQRETYLLQLCSGIDEVIAFAPEAQLAFASIDESFAGDSPLLPSGFRVVSLDSRTDNNASPANQTLDLASALDVGGAAPLRRNNEAGSGRSILTIAFQFVFEQALRDHVAAAARQYVRSVVASVQRVAVAIGS